MKKPSFQNTCHFILVLRIIHNNYYASIMYTVCTEISIGKILLWVRCVEMKDWMLHFVFCVFRIHRLLS